MTIKYFMFMLNRILKSPKFRLGISLFWIIITGLCLGQAWEQINHYKPYLGAISCSFFSGFVFCHGFNLLGNALYNINEERHVRAVLKGVAEKTGVDFKSVYEEMKKRKIDE